MRRIAMVTVLLAGGILAGCGGDKPAKSPFADLPPYEGDQQRLFDDQIDPAAVGLSMAPTGPEADPLLPGRTSDADIVARMRVQTLTQDSVGAKTHYALNVQVGMPPLMPVDEPETEFELVVEKHSPSFGLVQAVESTIKDLAFIGFVRRFQGDDGPVLHWHLTADTQEVAQVIQEIAVLEEVAGEELQ